MRMSNLIDGRRKEIDARLIHHSQEQDGNVLIEGRKPVQLYK